MLHVGSSVVRSIFDRKLVQYAPPSLCPALEVEALPNFYPAPKALPALEAV